MKIKTGNLGFVKQANKSIILNIIRTKGTISRADISKLTGLNRATVSSLVSELIEESLVFESESFVTKVGRTPVLLHFNENASSIIGIELGLNHVYIIVANLNAKVIWDKVVDLSSIPKNRDFFDYLGELIDEAICNAPTTPRDILGIGIGVQGIVNTKKGIVLNAPNSYPFNWVNVPLYDILQEKYPNLYIAVDNEANLGALGEKWFGAGKPYDNLIYLAVGSGIGAGVIQQNELYTGVNGIAGEVGHTTIQINGRRCICGNRGCWSMYGSAHSAIEKLTEEIDPDELAKKIGKEISHLTMYDLKILADQGDQKVIEILQKTAWYLGIGVANIINYYNPQAIIIGKTINQAGSWILEPLKEAIKERSLIKDIDSPIIKLSELGEKSSVIGTVARVFEEKFRFPEIGLKANN